jgi:hypothetical protein
VVEQKGPDESPCPGVSPAYKHCASHLQDKACVGSSFSSCRALATGLRRICAFLFPQRAAEDVHVRASRVSEKDGACADIIHASSPR